MDNYYIGCDIEGHNHIYKKRHDFFSTQIENYIPEPQELTWQGLILTVRPRIFYNWLFKPREIGDEFPMFGQTFVVIDRWYGADELICTIADAVGYRLLLHRLIWNTELNLLMRSWWASIPNTIKDSLSRDIELDQNIDELKKQFREERDASSSHWLAQGQATSM